MPTKTQLHELYYWMQLTRILEEKLVALYRTGKVVGGVYTGRGQEAIAIGTAYALEKDDLLAPMIRNLAPCSCAGFAPRMPWRSTWRVPPAQPADAIATCTWGTWERA